MIYATGIKMCITQQTFNNCQDIDSIYLEGVTTEGYYKKAALYDYLKKYPNTIKVKIGSEPFLLPTLSIRNEKYVKSEPNDTVYDNLLQLPRY